MEETELSSIFHMAVMEKKKRDFWVYIVGKWRTWEQSSRYETVLK